MKNNIYMSGSWKNRVAIRQLMNDMENLSYKIVVNWTNRKITDDARIAAEQNIKGLQECDCLIYCMDGIRSRGKYFELGYATALGKPIAIYLLPTYYNVINPNDEHMPFNIVLENESVFIRSRVYTILCNIDELKNWLSDVVDLNKRNNGK
jgi:nucleoside 2-deoxyribosyltransferase